MSRVVPLPPPVELSEELVRYRATLSTEEGMAAVGVSTVEGMEGVVVKGASPAARAHVGAATGTPIKNPAVIRSTLDAEVDLANNFVAEMEARGISSTSSGTLEILVEEPPCPSCKSGLRDRAAQPGALRQLSERYPNVVIRVRNTTTSEIIEVLGGERIR